MLQCLHSVVEIELGFHFRHLICRKSGIAEGYLLESKDGLVYHYGPIHCGEKLFREIDRADVLAWR